MILRRLVFFHLDAVRVGVGVLANSRHLPGDFHVRFICADGELVMADFRRHDCVRKQSDHSQLVAEVAVEGFEPVGQRDDRQPRAVRSDVAVVDIPHVGRFDEGVVTILVRRIERMVDFERAGGFAQRPGDIHTSELLCVTSAKAPMAVALFRGVSLSSGHDGAGPTAVSSEGFLRCD